MICPTCGQDTPADRNFCIHCKHKVRDLKGVIRLGSGCRRSAKMDYFWDTGDSAVFAKEGALDYDPRLP